MRPEKEAPPTWVSQIDLDWIEQNFDVFQSAVRKVFDHVGRGAVVIDVTMPPVDDGHPFSYWPQSDLEKKNDDEVNRLVREYAPQEELVVILLKPKKTIHAYRVGPALF